MSAVEEHVRSIGRADQASGDTTFLLLGEERGIYPLFDRLPLVRDPSAPYDAVIVASPVGEPRLFDALSQTEKWLAPVVNLSGIPMRADDVCQAAPTDLALQQGLDVIAPILERQRTLGNNPNLGGEPGLRALAMAYTRGRPLEAHLAPDLPDLVAYPLLRGIDTPATVLADLAESKLVQPQFHQRFHVCERCNSARVNVREECIDCRSSHLAEESLIHHYRCGHQAEESQFRRGRELRCPKCRRALNHYAVDYDKPGNVHICRACDYVASEPAIGFLCADCGHTQDATQATTRDWFHYSLLPAGLDALRQGTLPHRSLQNVFLKQFGAMTFADFLAAARVITSIARRHQRPLSGMTLRITNAEQVAAQAGAGGLVAVYRQLGDIITQALRESDLVTALDGVIHVVLPETPADQGDVVQRRIQGEVERVISLDVGLRVERLDLDGVDALGEQGP